MSASLLYDLASAAMYVGGLAHAGDLIDAYLKQGMLARAEVDHGLAAMLRFRWAVQANYFAWRIAQNDLTGISGPGENEKGLEDTRRSLAFLSVGLGRMSGEIAGGAFVGFAELHLGFARRVADVLGISQREALRTWTPAFGLSGSGWAQTGHQDPHALTAAYARQQEHGPTLPGVGCFGYSYEASERTVR